MKKKGFGVLAVLMLSMLLSVTVLQKESGRLRKVTVTIIMRMVQSRKVGSHSKKRNLLFSAKDRDHGNRCAADRRKDLCIFQKKEFC